MDKVNEFFTDMEVPVDKIIDWAIVIVVLIIALIIAKIVSGLIRKGINKASFLKNTFEKIGVNVNLEKVGNITSKIVYFLLVFAIFIGALESNYIDIDTTKLPLIGNLKDFVNGVISAGFLSLVAWFLASIAKVTITKGLKTSDLDKKISENIKTEGDISESVGIIAYWVIILFFLPKILENLRLDNIANQIEGILQTITNYIPDLFGAALIIVIFYFVGKIVSKLIGEFLSKVGFDKILGLIGLKNVESKTSPSTVVGNLVFAYILLFAITEASEALSLENISTMVNKIIVFSVNIILGVVILAIGMYLGNLSSNAVKSATNSKILPMVAKAGIVILTIFMALQQMQIGGDIVNQAFTLLLGSIAVAFALAVGLGSKEVAGEEVKKLIEKLKK